LGLNPGSVVRGSDELRTSFSRPTTAPGRTFTLTPATRRSADGDFCLAGGVKLPDNDREGSPSSSTAPILFGTGKSARTTLRVGPLNASRIGFRAPPDKTVASELVQVEM
jgi:hypothetical protein